MAVEARLKQRSALSFVFLLGKLCASYMLKLFFFYKYLYIRNSYMKANFRLYSNLKTFI